MRGLYIQLNSLADRRLPLDSVNAQKLIMLVDFCAPQRGPAPTAIFPQVFIPEVIALP